MRNAWLIFALFFFAACNSNKIINVAEEETPKSVTNYLTEQYKDFPGTKLSILPTEKFTYDASVGGWSSASKLSWIIASSIHGRPLQAAGLYKARLTDATRPDALDGMLIGEWDIIMNSRTARLFKVQTSLGGDDYLQYILFTGDSASAYRITGNVHEDELALVPQMKKSLLSIFFDPERKIGQSQTQTSASPCNCPKQ